AARARILGWSSARTRRLGPASGRGSGRGYGARHQGGEDVLQHQALRSEAAAVEGDGGRSWTNRASATRASGESRATSCSFGRLPSVGTGSGRFVTLHGMESMIPRVERIKTQGTFARQKTRQTRPFSPQWGLALAATATAAPRN